MKIKAGLKFRLKADVEDYKAMLRDSWAGSMTHDLRELLRLLQERNLSPLLPLVAPFCCALTS